MAGDGRSSGRLMTPAVDLEARLLQAMDRAKVPGLSLTILSGGRVEPTRVFGVKNRTTKEAVSAQTVFEACSLSKPVLAYAALILVAEGRLDLDKPLLAQASEEVLAQEFFRGKIEDDRIRRITPHMVLSHRSGFPNWRPINDFVRERVFIPLGMTSSSYVWIPEYDVQAAIPHSLFGEPGNKGRPLRANGAASLHTTSNDYALFLAALLQGRGLGEDLHRQMMTEQTAVSPGVGWGLGVGLEIADGREYLWHWGDNGDFKCFFMVDSRDRSGFVYFSKVFLGIIFRPLPE